MRKVQSLLFLIYKNNFKGIIMPFEIMLFLLCAIDFTLVDGGATTKSLLSNRKFFKLFF